jgi:octanoyl-[GcvH]:protein N-octanoyltransferase
VSTVFGGPVQLEPDITMDVRSRLSPAADMERVSRQLCLMQPGHVGSMRVFRPLPTAAFAPRDLSLAGYAVATKRLCEDGFTPVERRTGGQLAVYDDTALIIDLVVAHPQPRLDVIERFRSFAAAICSALAGFGIDAGVGPVPGEYCPGEYSVNAGGLRKIAGLAQRIVRCGYHLGAVIAVEPSPRVQAAAARAYDALGLHLNAASFGAAADAGKTVGFVDLRDALVGEMLRRIEVI